MEVISSEVSHPCYVFYHTHPDKSQGFSTWIWKDLPQLSTPVLDYLAFVCLD